MKTTLEDQIRDVGRELGMRRSCYPRWVREGRMKQEDADYRIACMEDILATLQAIKEERDANPNH